MGPDDHVLDKRVSAGVRRGVTEADGAHRLHAHTAIACRSAADTDTFAPP